MKPIMFVLLALLCGLTLATAASADEAISVADAEDVSIAGNQLTIALAMPASAVGARIDRAVLEVPLTTGGTENSLFTKFPLIEIMENGSELPKQTTMLASGFEGLARIDVTRFVRQWSNTSEHEFVIGAVSQSNETIVGLNAISPWSAGVKARLVLSFSTLDGESARSAQ